MDAAGRFWLFGGQATQLSDLHGAAASSCHHALHSGYDGAALFDDLWYFAEASSEF